MLTCNQKNYVIIFNYNLPGKTTAIYEKLLLDGFEDTQIMVVDNGSDRAEIARSTNFLLPFNIRFTGQAYMALTFIMEFCEFDNLVMITTSAGLKDELNYMECLNRVLDDHSYKFGYITASLSGGDSETNAHEQMTTNLEHEYKQIYKYQPIFTVISKELITKCRESKSSYFNLDLKRGWGIDRELQYIANIHGLPCYVSKSLSVNWDTNLTHRKGMADESREKYHLEASIEMESVFSKKYGLNWNDIFIRAFDERHSGESITKALVKKFLYSSGIIRLIR
ncbi:hypothetical protein ACI1IE_004188 [Vibrio vulnificus]